MRKIHSAEEMKLKVQFEQLRTLLLQEKYATRWNHSLAFWTLPNDRRLPISLLNFTLRQIIDHAYEELANTSGVGQKKLNSLVLLLKRAADDTPPSTPITLAESPQPVKMVEEFKPVDAQGAFDHTLVSEALWREWRETAETHNLCDQKLGYLAPSLQGMPTVIWNTPLKTYSGQSLQEIRNLRTHGEKRVHVILEVFFVAHEMLRNAGRHPRLSVKIEPRFVAAIEQWFEEILALESLPSRSEIMEHVALPLVEQLTVDAGADVVHLARGRLGIEGNSISVRQQSRDMRVTRARIYQLLEECERIMSVRWPRGRRLFQELGEKFKGEHAESQAAELFFCAYDLFFPRKYARLESLLGADDSNAT